MNRPYQYNTSLLRDLCKSCKQKAITKETEHILKDCALYDVTEKSVQRGPCYGHTKNKQFVGNEKFSTESDIQLGTYSSSSLIKVNNSSTDEMTKGDNPNTCTPTMMKDNQPSSSHGDGNCGRLHIINFRSVLNKKEELETLMRDKDPDIVIGTETWLRDDVRNVEFFPNDFNIFRRDRKAKNKTNKQSRKNKLCNSGQKEERGIAESAKRNRSKTNEQRSENYIENEHVIGGGVMIAIKKNIASEEIIIDQNMHVEAVFCKVNTHDKQPLIIGSVYRPPDTSMDINEEICDTIRKIVLKFRKATFLIGGDFNLPDIDWKRQTSQNKQNNSETNNLFMETALDLNLVQVVDESTRQDSTLDLLFTNIPSVVQYVETIPGISDHDIIQAEYRAKVPKQKQPKREVYLWKKADIPHIKAELKRFSNYFLKSHNQAMNIDTLWKCIKDNVLTIVNENVPTKLTTTRNNKPWIDRETKRILRKKKKLFKRNKLCPTESNKRKYEEIKRLAQKQCRRAHANFVNDMFNEDEKTCKQFWSYIKSKNRENTGVAPLRDENGAITLDALKKANILNRQFSSVFSDPTGDIPTDFSKNQKSPQINAIHITEEGVVKLMSELKENKATGPDGISAKILKTFALELAPVFTFFYQASLNQGEIPKEWKCANVTPIFKKGDKNKAENYRPVSLTSIPCKLLEHIIASHIMHYLDNHDLLTDVQHGFRRNRSCESQLITTCADFLDVLNNHGQTDAILLDFSKAFDKVHHKSLLAKLENYGVNNCIHAWITSFLSDRTQKVMVENKMSESLPVLSGVPQGTVLGPILFLIYINDMPAQVSEGTRIRLFADDSLLYREIKCLEDTAVLERDLQSLQRWEKEWKMQFHPQKCKVMSITNKRKPIHAVYTIHNQELENVSEAEYLGLTINNKMSWNSHIDKVCRKANKRINFLRRNISFCSRTIKEKSYKSIVRPILEYGGSVWDPHTKSNINKIEHVQRRGCRFVHNKRNKAEGITALMDENQWESLQERRAKAKTKIFFRAKNGTIKIPTQHLQEKERKPGTFHLPVSNINAHLHSFFPSTVRLWNSLPQEVRQIKTIEQFADSLSNIKMLQGHY